MPPETGVLNRKNKKIFSLGIIIPQNHRKIYQKSLKFTKIL